MEKQQPVSARRQQVAGRQIKACDVCDSEEFSLVEPGQRAVAGSCSRLLLVLVLALLLAGCGAGHSEAQSQPGVHLAGNAAGRVVLTPESGRAEPALVSAQETREAARVNALFTGLLAQQKFSGTVLIEKGGQVLLEQGYGMANWATRVPNGPQTRFYLGSVTKEFTAAALLLLQQQGKLRVQNSICAYVVPCPPPWQPVTLHDILTHTSGIPELDTSRLSGASPAAWIASFNNAPLAFTPGSEFAYCSVCYQILAYVVQTVSGQPYQHFMQTMVFTPLHMASTGFNANFYYSQRNDAHGYASWRNEAGELGWAVDPSWSFLFGSGLLYSTVGDLALWDRALTSDVLLNQQSRNAAITSYTSNSLFAGSTYGYGWFIAKSPVPGHRLIWHDGVIDGFRTYIGRYIDDNVTVIFLSNLATVDSPTLAQTLQPLLFT